MVYLLFFQCVVMSAIRTTDYLASPQHEGFISELVCSILYGICVIVLLFFVTFFFVRHVIFCYQFYHTSTELLTPLLMFCTLFHMIFMVFLCIFLFWGLIYFLFGSIFFLFLIDLGGFRG
jgi:hypothetical protein